MVPHQYHFLFTITTDFVSEPSFREYLCAVCLQPSTAEQPTYCLHCFIPIPTYKVGKYIGAPIGTINIPQEYITLTQAHDAVENLGISHLPPAEQAAALSSLSREKINPMSGEYEFIQAGQLAELGKILAEDTMEQWAQDMTITVHSIYLLRIGENTKAAKQLDQIFSRLPVATDIERLRRLEVLALRALANRLAGNVDQANKLLQQTMQEVGDEFEKTEAILARYLEEANIKSEYLGLNNRTTRFPRLDYFTRIISILVEESITRGGEETPLPDDTLDRMLELDNITHQLARISPPDDPAFFGAQLREYLRLFNGIFWYGDIMINNDGIKRRLLIERAYTRIQEWMEFLPVHFWLSLRLSRFLEIFTRAEAWSENIKVQAITEAMLQQSSTLHRPSFLYVFAEFSANTGLYDKALEYVAEVLSPNYEKDLDPTLRSMAQRMQQSIELERAGILMGVSKPNEWMQDLIMVEYQDQGEKKQIEMDSKSDLMEFGIAIFGDRLVEHMSAINQNITKVGPREIGDPQWDTTLTDDTQSTEGLRMDVVLLKTKLSNDDDITLLFEGKKQQQIPLSENKIRLEPSELLLLRGINHRKELRINDIIQVLGDILTGHSTNDIEISTLKTI